MKLMLTNTLSGKKEQFVPLRKNNVDLYVCGITPYDNAHMGHGRVYVTFDMVYRLLAALGYRVSYCRNFTDIDDKLLNRAELELGDRLQYGDIAQRYIAAFSQDMKALNCMLPTYEPRVTETMPEIITFIQGLLKAGVAYEAAGDVYFSITQFPNYGALSKRTRDDLRAGARVEVSAIKRDPLDFALWKAEPAGMFWQAPWGWGRPGWHIECSAMAQKYLGNQLDIHAGGMDLIFPHHENEIAQSEGLLKKKFVQYWLHVAFITVRQEKMSKSLGNFFTLRDVFAQFHPMVVRYYLLNHHYRSPLEFSFDDLQAAQKSYQRLALLCAEHACASCELPFGDDRVNSSPLIKNMIEYLCDDLNTVGMLGVVFEHLSHLRTNQRDLCGVKALLGSVLGLTLEPLPERKVEITPEIQRLLDERDQARISKDWKRADELRDQLRELGIEVRDRRT